MKSTKKIFYNHRIAQSKEKWETDFLSKIKSPENLLYLAAVKANKYTPLPKDDSFYTDQNKSSILSSLDGIVASQYNQRHHKDFLKWAAKAKEILEEKIEQQQKKLDVTIEENPTETVDFNSSPAESTNIPVEPVNPSLDPKDKPGRSTANEDVHTGNYPELIDENIFDIDSFGPDAKIFIKDYIQPLKILADKDKNGFKQLGADSIKKASVAFLQAKEKFSNDEYIAIQSMLNNLQTRYSSAYSETGLTRAGKSYAVVDYIEAAEEAKSLLSDKVRLRDPKIIEARRNQIEKILNIYQTKFINKSHPNDIYIVGNIMPINKLIGNFNYNYTNMNPKNNTNIESLDLLRPRSS